MTVFVPLCGLTDFVGCGVNGTEEIVMDLITVVFVVLALVVVSELKYSIYVRFLFAIGALSFGVHGLLNVVVGVHTLLNVVGVVCMVVAALIIIAAKLRQKRLPENKD